MEQLVHGERAFSLRRLPLKPDDRLRAWDAADEYLLRFLAAEPGLPTDGRLLLANEAFGALAVALHERGPVAWGDSHLARLALSFNLDGNRIDPATVPFVPATSVPTGPFDLAVLKLPRSLVFFRDQLLRLRPALAPTAQVLVGGMIKHTPKRAWQILDEVIGPTTTTRGWKKARLGRAHLAARPDLPESEPAATYLLPGTDLALQNLPNVFSRERLDAGSRLLLQHLPQHDDACDVLDLGCGNGVLSVALARQCPGARILGVDESYQAVASARLNAGRLDPATAARLEFRVDDSAAAVADASCDLVVCNPPFHHGHTTGDLPAWAMFTAARRVLRPGGELRLVGNRHLGYHAKLRRLFPRVVPVAADERFVVLGAFNRADPR